MKVAACATYDTGRFFVAQVSQICYIILKSGLNIIIIYSMAIETI